MSTITRPPRTRRAAALVPSALALAGLALSACSEGPTSTELDPPAVSFHHSPGHGGGPGGGEDDGGDASALQFVLVDPAGIAGVYSDALGPYPSTMLDSGAGLHPTCDDREFQLRHVLSTDQSVITDAEINAILANQSTCDGATGGSDTRRAFLKAPGILTVTDDCDSGDADEMNDCPFDTYPSYEWKGNRIKPTGMFSNAARHFEVDRATGDQLTWVFQDPSVTILTRDADGAPTSWRLQATTIHLYGDPSWELCVGGGDADMDGVPEGCLNFPLSVDFTLEPEGP